MRIASRYSSRRGAAPRAPGASASRRQSPETLAPTVAWLTGLGTTPHWVVSCYLKLEPRDRARGKYLIKLKNRMKDQLAWLERQGPAREEREAVGRDFQRIREYLEQSDNLPAGRGIAIFACEPLELFSAIALPEVFRSRLAVDHTPLVRELAALQDEFGLVVCAAYDRTSARLFQVTAAGIEELPSVIARAPTRTGRFHGASEARGAARGGKPGGRGGAAASAGEHNYNQRIREEKQRHYAEVAQSLFDIARGRAVRGVVLAGVGTDAGAVVPHLHPSLRSLLLGVTKINPKAATLAGVMEAVLAVRHEKEREWETAHVATLIEGLGGGWAVNGVEATLRALSRGQVGTLLVDPGATVAGFRCGASGRLTIASGGCRGEGEPEPVSDVIDDAIEDALRQRSHVDVVEDDAAREKIDGLAALLRFKQ